MSIPLSPPTTRADRTPRTVDPRRRTVRVVMLLVAVVLLSLGDLYMTLVHLRGVGMVEANPIAREVIDLNSPPALAAWKLATVVLAVGLLFVVRRTRSGEIGAWLAVAVLTWLTVRWTTYSEELAELHPEYVLEAVQRDPNWVAMAPGE
jgi:Domain of unknown function (DUF5658)